MHKRTDKQNHLKIIVLDSFTFMKALVNIIIITIINSRTFARFLYVEASSSTQPKDEKKNNVGRKLTRFFIPRVSCDFHQVFGPPLYWAYPRFIFQYVGVRNF